MEHLLAHIGYLSNSHQSLLRLHPELRDSVSRVCALQFLLEETHLCGTYFR